MTQTSRRSGLGTCVFGAIVFLAGVALLLLGPLEATSRRGIPLGVLAALLALGGAGLLIKGTAVLARSRKSE